ncbi:MAG: fused protease/ribonucleoside-triphosphate reductase, partial [Nitrosomonadaceae bacterium]|nr:fused protease/ribonucleoside-triphosphate reductase [Nitrosomonadaceae bacterium]
LMDASMLGVGVGFDLKGAGEFKVKGPADREPRVFVIPDSREGWVESVRQLINSHFQGLEPVKFDYSQIRKEGEPIKGFGGVSSGPAPLVQCHKDIRRTLEKNRGELISITCITDIMNMIGACVVSGNVRRSAEIVFGDPFSDEYLSLKDYHWDDDKEKYVGPKAERADYGWASNNSIFAKLGMDYTKVALQTAKNGEPGYAWLENMQQYSRMNNGPDNKDHRVMGGNPCLEQSLESMELCCLVETFPNNHENLEDYLKTLKYAYMYAKTVTLCETHWPETNRVMLRNRRIGCSMSGIAQFIGRLGLAELRTWCVEGYKAVERYDDVYSDWFAIPKSIKRTSVKPSGTVSLLAGATPGVHFPLARYYIRRMRLGKNSDLVPPLIEAGFKVEPSGEAPETSVVVEVPVDIGEGIRSEYTVSMWEKLQLAAFMQRYWADNQVSCTVSFKPEEADQIAPALSYFQYQLKGISFLPLKKKKAFK